MTASVHPTLQPELERRSKELFESIADLDAEGRRRELDRLAGGDAALRARVERLLEHAEPGERFLGGSIWDMRLEGRRVGSYRIGARIGEGGSGTVHVAERVQGDFAHRVAVKFLARGLGSERARRRFEQERSILAALQHPGIAGLLDGGTTDDGIPFVVMEFVEGVPITGYCDRERLSVADRIRLLQRVCGAVSYAHAALVVHRDLKPGNILVTAQGVPKLLDFGIAKLLEPDTDQTTTEDRVLTIKYASPEQLAGALVTTASDTFSLGVLLYELLTGFAPFRRDRLPQRADDVSDCQGELVLPSRRLARAAASADEGEQSEAVRLAASRGARPPSLVRELAGDLDEIVRRCLEIEPRDRYESPEALATDLDRYLLGLPVSARPLSLLERGARLARRRPTAAVLLALIAVLVAFLAVQSSRWRAEREAAASDRRRLTGVEQFLVESLRLTDPERELLTSISAREALERASSRLDQLEGSPEALAALATTIGNGFLDLGLYPLARARFERASEVAGRLHDAARRPLLADASAGLARTLVLLAEAEAAATLARGALANGETGVDATVRARLRIALAEASLELHRLDEAESAARAALEILRAESPEDARERFASLDVLTRILEAKGDLAAAERLARETIALIEARAASDRRGSTRRVDRVEHTTAGSNLGLILYRRGDAAGAEPLFRDVLERRRAELPADHPALADAANNLAMVEIVLGRPDAAEALLREALGIWQATLVPSHQLLADVHHNLGYLRRSQNRLDEAEQYQRKALAISELRYGAGHPNLAGGYSGLGWTSLARGNPRRAVDDFTHAVEAARSSPEPGRIDLGLALVGRAVARDQLGRFAEGGSDLREALGHLRADDGAATSSAIAAAEFEICLVARLQGDLAEAERRCRSSLLQLETAAGPRNIWVLELQAYRAAFDTTRNRSDEAVRALGRLVGSLAGATGNDASAALNVRALHALALAEAGREREADTLLADVLATAAEGVGSDHPQTLAYRVERAVLRIRLGEGSQVEDELAGIARAATARLGPHHWLADLACLLGAAARPSGTVETDAASSCSGASNRLEAAFPDADARPRELLARAGVRLVRSSSV